MLRKLARILFPFYGLLLIAGGIAGYQGGKSRDSLLVGTASGLVALLATMLANRYPRAANGIVALVALVLTAIMGRRWDKTGHIMPAGVIATLSGGMATLAAGAALRE